MQMNSQRVRIIMPLLILAAAGVALTVAAQNAGQIYAPAVFRGPVSSGSPVVKINFQPAAAEIPSGYLPDSGVPYADRGNGFAYGWNADTSTATRERNSAFAPDQRYDTLIHLQKEENPDAIWEIALPAGVYDVYAAAGDPEFVDGVMHSTAEGATLLNGIPNDSGRFIAGLVTVSVIDGRLTVRGGPNAVNNKLLFLEIYQVATLPTPTPAPTPSPTPPAGMVEFRGLWVTRFDWTLFNQPASPAKIDEIVDNAADAGFNAIFFQVRGAADAYYAPGLEPWAQRVSGGALGQPPSPFWDPLAYFVQRAHERGLQLHAYINVHPVWDNCTTPPPMTSPKPLYYLLQEAHGTSDGKLNGLQWTTTGSLSCSVYLRSSPASSFANDHIKAVAADLVNRYDIDGIHLDNVRYGGSSTSCDPVSAAAYGGPCFTGSAGQYQNWQREQVNMLVCEIYDEVIVPAGRELWLTAAVWPTYIDKWGWGYSEGYHDYYQDSQGWVKNGYIDAIAPMIYSSNPDTFPLDRWQTLAADFQANRGGRFITPGIGSAQTPFSEIANRIAAGRALGTAGHTLFSYGGLAANGYFDDLKAGPYAVPAAVPDIPWHD
jgi:uncharacterized lipoprotein YddW (UPF0748 family)